MPGEVQERQNVSMLSEAFSTFREASDRLVSTYQGLEEKSPSCPASSGKRTVRSTARASFWTRS